MSEKVKLVKLNDEQIVLAKNTNGERKKITHAVVCGKYGQLFGTEKQCRKYFSAWSKIFPKLFNGGEEVENFDIKDYQTTPELVMVLINANDSLEKEAKKIDIAQEPVSKAIKSSPTSWFKRLFGH